MLLMLNAYDPGTDDNAADIDVHICTANTAVYIDAADAEYV